VRRSVQLPLVADLPLDPAELAELTAPERGRIYDELGLDWAQRAEAEHAVRLAIATKCREERP
jgi:hypothetical protein